MFLPAFIMIAVLQNSFGLPTTTEHTPNLIDDLFDVLPKKELLELKAKHLKSDPGYQAAVKYFKSPGWVKIVEAARKTPEWIAYKSYLQEGGFDLDYLIKHIEHCLNSTNATAFKDEHVKPNLTNFIEDLKTTYGIKILKGIHEYLLKVEDTEDYQKLVEKATCPKSKKLLENAMKQPAMKQMVRKLKGMGVNIDHLVQMLYSFSGVEQSNTTTTTTSTTKKR